jgi:uncharacterized protein YbjT (DUF2867 family)
MKIAIVIGATGLVGSELVNQLLNSSEFSKVKIFVRKSTNKTHTKLEEYIVDFEEIENWKQELSGDTLFSCIGTTLKTVGTKEKQFNIDYNYPLHTIQTAMSQGVNQIVLVSSMGAKAGSYNFYLDMKGKLEEAIKALQPKSLLIFRPSILDGNRIEKRPAEHLAIKMMRFLGKLPFFKKYAPTKIDTLAKNMIYNALKEKQIFKIYESTEI